MSYNIDMECFSVQGYKELLKGQNLLPGRKGLLQNIDENISFRQGTTHVYLMMAKLIQDILIH